VEQVSLPLLKTKLYVPPVRSELVTRGRLVERLVEGAGRGCRLALISAPAGYGKTTLLSEWIDTAGLRHSVAWVSLDDGDNDPARFWSYVDAALQTGQEDIAGIDRAAFQSLDRLPIESLLIGLLNQIAAVPEPVVLVLDDYHVINTPTIHNGVAFLLENLPPHMQLVIATRVDPPLPIPRLRGRGQLVGLYQADLRFTAEEAAEFLNQVMGLNLTAEDVAALERRTEGWIAGLQMAAVSMRGHDDVAGFVRAFTGSHRYILDYLGGEVLQQQPERVRDFLMRTAILDRLTAPLCDAVITEGSRQEERGSSQAMLEHLERNSLFVVPLDDERSWYRYHRLFSDFLRQRLHRDRPHLVPELHRRASAWYEQHGTSSEAVSHLIAAGESARAADLIEQTAWALLARGECNTLLGWLDTLPDDLVHSRPRLGVIHAWALAFAGQLDSVAPRLKQVDLQRVPGEAAAVQAFVAGAQGDVRRAIALSRQASEYTHESNLFLRAIVAQTLGFAYQCLGDVAAASETLKEAVALSRDSGRKYLTMTATARLGRAQEVQGLLRQAYETHREALQLASDLGTTRVPYSGMVHVGIAEVLYEWNDLEGAVYHASEGIRLAELGGRVSFAVAGRIVVALVHQARGDVDRAFETIEGVERLAQNVYVTAEVARLRARLWTALGNLSEASRWVRESRLNPGDDSDATLLHEMEQTALVRLLIARSLSGELEQDYQISSRQVNGIDEARSVLTKLLEAAEAAGRGNSVINILILEALALQAQGHSDRAMVPLGRALSLAEPEGYVRSFVDEGRPMARLLRQALSQGITPSYVTHLLAVLGEEAELTSPGMESLIEPLTERELEVLRLIVAGLSNPEIAEELFVAVSTVKSHVNHIYGKLGVGNRVEAVTRAQALDLL
jgi:LuxR family maltose regulon positive regulatory protein